MNVSSSQHASRTFGVCPEFDPDETESRPTGKQLNLNLASEQTSGLAPLPAQVDHLKIRSCSLRLGQPACQTCGTVLSVAEGCEPFEETRPRCLADSSTDAGLAVSALSEKLRLSIRLIVFVISNFVRSCRLSCREAADFIVRFVVLAVSFSSNTLNFPWPP